jgi:CHASE1-domain containing sensor protein
MLIIVFLVAAIAAAATIGLITLTVIGITREESDKSLQREPSTRASAITRRIVGLHSIIRW